MLVLHVERDPSRPQQRLNLGKLGSAQPADFAGVRPNVRDLLADISEGSDDGADKCFGEPVCAVG